ncbi:ABC transporter permease [Agromyces aerolatus]|uniref:ABC transporter permease n=1 Tax=Agromyces sp. LY-1074 TaxID=3074080 RepID=UPI002857FD65|nr:MULTISPECIES: ABC transporter permease [unclassified Agromyces]MDR5701557.1 ABC transporter permease [Agromyces sp. LY-1074]MDR5707836.1 ABC transporter permease [Agromyces sp. LY-1358]
MSIFSKETRSLMVPSRGAADAAASAKNSWQLTFRRLRRDPGSIASAIGILLIVLFALGAPLIAQWTGHGPTQQFRETGLSPSGMPVAPNAEFLLGTDQLGRDLLVRLAYGAQVSLLVGVVASLAASVIGIIVGMTAGFFGGVVDMILSRVIDLVMSVPFLLVAIATVSVLGPSLQLSIAVIVFFSWAGLARVIRGQVLALREREFIEAARSLGESRVSMMFRDVLPNLVVPIVVYTTLMIPAAIVFEATLSFLGLGVVPPTPSWGNMLADAANGSMYMVAPWMVLVPGLALLALTLAFNLLGDGLRDALDPASAKGAKS